MTESIKCPNCKSDMRLWNHAYYCCSNDSCHCVINSATGQGYYVDLKDSENQPVKFSMNLNSAG